MKEIAVTEIENLKIGHAVLSEAKTGVSVLYFPQGAKVGSVISGGGPASRETPLTEPTTADNPINAIVLSGGSAYGLAASDGVMRCLEEHQIGYDTGVALVPLVCQSCIFDLGYGSATIRPDSSLGYQACLAALKQSDKRMGNVGAGIGATVGKLYGMNQAMKAGLGIHAITVGNLQIAAIVVVNALGDVYDYKNGRKLAGLTNQEGTEFLNSVEELVNFMTPRDMFTGNTTIGAIVTNAKFNKAEMKKIAAMASNAYARCINPVGTMGDGDTVYAASVGEEIVDLNLVGTLASEVMCEAIKKAVDPNIVGVL